MYVGVPQNVVIWEASAASLDKPKSVNFMRVNSSSVARRMFSGCGKKWRGNIKDCLTPTYSHLICHHRWYINNTLLLVSYYNGDYKAKLMKKHNTQMAKSIELQQFCTQWITSWIPSHIFFHCNNSLPFQISSRLLSSKVYTLLWNYSLL